ncbi:formylglycine-generating enzyme family protein [Arcticibacter tournemirensis]|uniref:Formylglycine-generating enzyme family protein n=1 Tax=Arcticibacter tournemirensis TaxID=699437 RepID=A0A4Q0MBL4_9SPHI|nr:formylglycine-generating enzyme family protein [Arcticibacter tournemirensis]RXF70453.1 formylglycine-generating enzyme family protein [Arcticibacter tournemirensis]
MESRTNIRIFSVIAVLLLLGTVASYSQANKAAAKGMVLIPAGSFKPFFEVKGAGKKTVRSFYLDVYAVTNSDFLRFVKANPQWSRSRISGLYADKEYLKHWESDFSLGKKHAFLANSPVTNISWFAARAYSKWAGKRLPTMDEWEYAAGAGIADKRLPIEKVILNWYSKPNPAVTPHVGSTFKNKLDVYDMHGLIWEWVSDFNSVMMGSDSRSGALNSNLFCAAGSNGAANKEDYAAFLRFAFRESLKGSYTINNLGFRCARDVKQ